MVLLQVTPPTHNSGHGDRGLSLLQFDQAEWTCIPCSSAYLLQDTFQHPRGAAGGPAFQGFGCSQTQPTNLQEELCLCMIS